MLLRAESFDDDAEKIARRLKQLVAAARRPGVSAWMAVAIAAGALATGIVLGPLAFRAARLSPPWAQAPAGADLVRLLDEADRGRRLAETKLLAALQAKATAEKEAQGRAAEVSRLGGLLATEKEKVRTAQDQIEALKAQAEAQKKAEAQAQARVDQLIKQLAAKDRELAAPKPPDPAPVVPTLAARPRPCIEIRAGNAMRCLQPGAGKTEWFKDCPTCPEMVVVPEGTFSVGDDAEPDRASFQKNWESPEHTVTIKQPFAVGRFAVTFDEWDACVAAGGCNGYRPDDNGWGRARRPVIKVSWHDARAYAAWISRVTGRSYRLLSEAEREYVTRAGTTTRFWWGSSISTSQANYGEALGKTVPVDTFAVNPWGLYQVHGNIYEWVEDCWNENYRGAPADGSAWTTGDCESRVLRGGAFFVTSRNLRSANRSFNPASERTTKFGFRVARTLGP
jgi:formylglycine-generating enzyme required for sulfatase activity